MRVERAREPADRSREREGHRFRARERNAERLGRDRAVAQRDERTAGRRAQKVEADEDRAGEQRQREIVVAGPAAEADAAEARIGHRQKRLAGAQELPVREKMLDDAAERERRDREVEARETQRWQAEQNTDGA